MDPIFGAILAGGASRRFGSPKALARLGGRTVLDRVASALTGVAAEVGVVTHLDAVRAATPLATRPDLRPGSGALGGIHAALHWARERGFGHALVVGCDMPLLSRALLRTLAEEATRSGAAAVVVESGGPHSVEPLCAVYAAAAIAEVEARIDAGDLALHRLVDALGARHVGIERVRALGDPALLFLNVNTAADLRRAARALTTGPDA